MNIAVYPYISKDGSLPADEYDNGFIFKAIDITHTIHESWKCLFLEGNTTINQKLKELYTKAYLNGLTVYPLPQDVLNCFSLPIEKVKVVIMAQDPYPGVDKNTKKPHACGRCFASESPDDTPGSLNRLRIEIVNRFGDLVIADKSRPNSLQGWINQGVMLMNYTPILYKFYGEEKTAKINSLLQKPMITWAPITRLICEKIREVNPKCYFLLVGRNAQKAKAYVSNPIETGHPSDLNQNNTFSGDCFEKIPDIRWNYI